MTRTPMIWVVIGLVAGLVASAAGIVLQVDPCACCCKSPGFGIGYSAGKFEPYINLKYRSSSDKETHTITNPSGGIDSSYSTRTDKILISPLIGTRYYLNGTYAPTENKLMPYLSAGLRLGFYSEKSYVNDKPVTGGTQATYPLRWGGDLGFGTEVNAMPHLTLSGELGLRADSHSSVQSFDSEGTLFQDKLGSCGTSVYARTGLNFRF